MPVTSPGAIVECVPNVSEGRDADLLARFAAAIRGTAGARLIDVHADRDHHRSVFTFAGDPGAVEAAALALAAAVIEAVDMRAHHGVHPRVGALDILPFVPLRDFSMAATVDLARRVGATLGARHELPVYYYGFAATRPGRRAPRSLRVGGVEGLAERLRRPDGAPDAGPARFDPRSGAILVGARDILIAFNVWLDGGDLEAARVIAAVVRESSGGLPAVQAMGIPLASRGIVQVAMNLLDYRTTSIPAAFDRVAEEAGRRGIAVSRAELVGVAPRAAFAGRAPASVGLVDFSPALYLESHLDPARA